MKILNIHHVQITIPPDKENLARKFYLQELGLREIRKLSRPSKMEVLDLFGSNASPCES